MHPHASSINQNQGGTVFPFDYPFSEYSELGAIVSDLHVTFKETGFDEVYVIISRSPSHIPHLIFYRSREAKEEHILLDTDDLEPKLMKTGIKGAAETDLWFFSDERGRDTVMYSEYLDTEGQYANYRTRPLQSIATPVKLVSRCWVSCTENIYYVGQQEHCNHLRIELGAGLKGQVNAEENTITLSADDIFPSDSNRYVKTINGVVLDSNRNFDLKGDGACIVTYPAHRKNGQDGEIVIILDEDSGEEYDAMQKPNALSIRNDCTECCSCEKYADHFEVLNCLIRLHNYEVAYLKYLTEYYEAIYQHYVSAIDNHMQDSVAVKATSTSTSVTIQVSISNPTGQSIFGVMARLEVLSNNKTLTLRHVYLDGAKCDENSRLSYDGRFYTITVDEIRPHRSWSGALVFSVEYSKDSVTARWQALNLPWHEVVVESTTFIEDEECTPPVCLPSEEVPVTDLIEPPPRVIFIPEPTPDELCVIPPWVSSYPTVSAKPPYPPILPHTPVPPIPPYTPYVTSGAGKVSPKSQQAFISLLNPLEDVLVA